MDNELRKTLDVKLNINIDGTAAFGIVLASIADYVSVLYRYEKQILCTDWNFEFIASSVCRCICLTFRFTLSG